MDRVTSRELTELRAYELVNGPIGAQYTDELLASIHEQLQEIGRILIAQHAEDEDDIPPLQRYPRPHELYKTWEDQDG